MNRCRSIRGNSTTCCQGAFEVVSFEYGLPRLFHMFTWKMIMATRIISLVQSKGWEGKVQFFISIHQSPALSPRLASMDPQLILNFDASDLNSLVPRFASEAVGCR